MDRECLQLWRARVLRTVPAGAECGITSESLLQWTMPPRLTTLRAGVLWATRTLSCAH